MQGTISYIKKTIPLPQPSSAKRQRIRYKRQGSNTYKTIVTMELDQSLQPSDIHLRHAIYYVYVHVLDAPHEEHWLGKEGTIAVIANWMESHVGFRMTTTLVNEHRREQGDERVSVSAVNLPSGMRW